MFEAINGGLDGIKGVSEPRSEPQVISPPKLLPRKVFFTKGVGRHTDPLVSFELALRDAGIEKFNLVTVSSIYPPYCEIVDADAIYQITATAKPEEMTKLLETALKGNFMEAREMLDKLMIEYGMSGEDIVAQLFREIIALPINERVKVHLIDKLGEIDFRLTEGANERIQLDAYLAFLSSLAKK
jgi:DNA polymerase III delta prime subunit